MSFQERIGCFFLAIGLAVFLLWTVPIVQAFRKDPGNVPPEGLGIAALGLLLFWMGWKLFRAAQQKAESQRPPSLGARLLGKRKSEEKEKGK